MTKLQIVIIRDKNQFIHNKFNQAAIKTMTKKTRFINHILTYHAMKAFSSSENEGSVSILFFTNGAKNITPAIAESLASDEMMLLLFSIVNIR